MNRLACLAGLLALTACAGAPPPEPLNPVRFLSINDVYVTDTLNDGSGGLARVATVRNRLADQGPILFVLAGDALSPSLLSKYYHGRQMVEALNAAKLDYATFGNHEFELDRDTLVDRIAASKFKWLSSNCIEANGQPFPKVLPWDTLRVSKHKVGIFGLTLPGPYRSYVRCTNPDSAAHRTIETLVDQGAELVVALTHQSIQADRDLLARESHLDLILGGHEHEAHDSVVSGRHVLKADANSRTAQFVTLWGGKDHWRQAVGLVHMDDRIPADPAVDRVVETWSDSLQRRLGPEREVGTTTKPLDARDLISRNQESPVGDLVTDAVRAGTGADVALLNAGSMRLDDVIPPGALTNYQLESIFLFADETRIVTFPLSGSRLRALLEHAVADSSIGKGAFLQVSGVSFNYDLSRASGSRVIGPLRQAQGGTIADSTTLQVAFDAYPACHGGDGYQVPEAAASCAKVAEAPRAVDLLQRYITDSLKGKIEPPAGGRISRQQSTNPG